MASQAPTYTTKELSSETWPDFARLFSQGGGWDFCWCMHFHRARAAMGEKRLRTRAEKGARNRREKKDLVEAGRSHGILVYAAGEPVGWCQYGHQEELPRIDSSRKYRTAAVSAKPGPRVPGKSGADAKPMQREAFGGTPRLWRITCFVGHKKYRRHGVASVALKAALESIKKQGGGLVEGYPINWWVSRAFGNESTHGTATMFKKAGFKTVASLGATRFSSHVVMRRTV